MLRRVVRIALVATVLSSLVPAGAFAQQGSAASDKTQSFKTIQDVNEAGTRTSRPLSLQNAVRGVVFAQSASLQQTTNKTPFMKTTGGKFAVAAAVIAATVAASFAASKGPDPTPATAR
jgi:hypothetical protein